MDTVCTDVKLEREAGIVVNPADASAIYTMLPYLCMSKQPVMETGISGREGASGRRIFITKHGANSSISYCPWAHTRISS